MNQPRQCVSLLDVGPGETEVFDVSFLERTGHPVHLCYGAGAKLCPLLGGEGCSDFDAAHGIVFQLDLDHPQHRDIVRRFCAVLRPDLPIQVLVAPGQADRYAEFLTDVEVWTHERNAVPI